MSGPLILGCHCGNGRGAVVRRPVQPGTFIMLRLAPYHHPDGNTIFYCSVCGARVFHAVPGGIPQPMSGCVDFDIGALQDLLRSPDPFDRATVWPDGVAHDKLHVRCLCGEVQIAVRRPTAGDGLQEWLKGYIPTFEATTELTDEVINLPRDYASVVVVGDLLAPGSGNGHLYRRCCSRFRNEPRML
jgi:hypothetical protein